MVKLDNECEVIYEKNGFFSFNKCNNIRPNN